MNRNSPLPDLSKAQEWFNGNETIVKQHPEKMILVHFWSVSCILCKKDFPELNQLKEDFADDVVTIAVHMPRKEIDYDRTRILSDLNDFNISQPCILDQDQTITGFFENRFVPAYYLFDRSGKLRHFQAGGRGIAMLKRRISRIASQT
ncbi:redoxin domain-containing protein [Salisediminibacterium beveridgei]|uniref:Thiol-disulfide oxidoreductase ykuV n=1 Tax=Salisediminibacterium beveridgei TaxID=632773 RepID=A0A1D7QU45_9BACI|nr:redoxin domain-containing protein [Salisediminibacterium beveridgei]AOM82544.1 Thiol-disulfide oxidoreductase ykuV [Salisediminibacterium beveridgei]